MATYDTNLIRQQEVAAGTTQFTFAKPEGFTYRAGQFGDIVLSHPDGTPKQESTHGFSFVSAPFEEHLRMTTRMRDTPFKNAIRDTPDGTAVQLLATFGDFTLQKNEKTPAVFVIGGIGITPIRSMIAQALHDKTGHDLTLIYANRTAAQAAYTDELRGWAEAHANFTFVPIYTEQDGHVNADTIRQHVADIAGAKYYLSGPEGMVKAMRTLLLEVDADEDNIRTEEFEGY